jgi:hypothetical protein
MKEPCEKCKALFQMRIGELEKRMDYKFEQRTRRVELLKGSSVKKVRIATHFQPEWNTSQQRMSATSALPHSSQSLGSRS